MGWGNAGAKDALPHRTSAAAAAAAAGYHPFRLPTIPPPQEQPVHSCCTLNLRYTHLEGRFQRVQKLERCGLLAGRNDCIGEVDRAGAALLVVLRNRCGVGACGAGAHREGWNAETGVAQGAQPLPHRRRREQARRVGCLKLARSLQSGWSHHHHHRHPPPHLPVTHLPTRRALRPSHHRCRAPAASASACTTPSSASVSVAKRLMATTTGTPKVRALAMWRARLQQPARRSSRFSEGGRGGRGPVWGGVTQR